MGLENICRHTLVALLAAIVCIPTLASGFRYENCPGPMSVDTPANSDTVAVTWEHPYLTGLGKVGSVSQTVSHKPGEKFPIGMTRVNYLAINSTDYRDLQVCTFVITVNDRIPPVFHTCPINVTTRLGPDQNQTKVTWDIPQATDNSKFVQLLTNHEPGTNFTAGTVSVTYTARDTTGNVVHCQFPVIVIPFVTVATTDATTTATTTATTAAGVTTVATVQKGGKGKGGKGKGGVHKPSEPKVVDKTINWKSLSTQTLIWITALCFVALALAIIGGTVLRKYWLIRRLKAKRIGGDEEAEIYPSSGGEEYDIWEDPPGGQATYQVSPSGVSGTKRVNKAEQRPLLVAGGQ